MRCESCAYFAGKERLLPFVVADEQRIDSVRSRSIAADDKLLLLIELQLHPGAAALARLVARISSLGDDSFEADARPGIDDVLSASRERFRQQNAGPFYDRRQPASTFVQRLTQQLDTVEMKDVERIEDDRVIAVRGAMLQRLE